MHIDVSDILRSGEGHQVDYIIDGETPAMEGLRLAAPLGGSIRIIGTGEGVLATGELATNVELECSRCLRAFTHTVRIPLAAAFSQIPHEDEFVIDKRGMIDLTEPVRQELELQLPLSPLCQEDCAGIELKQKKDS